jgi:NADH-quinone oxidoreductase subunit N
MYFDAPTDSAPIRANIDVKILLSANGIAVALLGMFPDTLMMACTEMLFRSL